MGLIIKRNTKAFLTPKDWCQNPTSFVLEQFLLETGFTLLMLHFMLDFQENEGDSRALKKVQELVQHFREQCKHYVLTQNNL